MSEEFIYYDDDGNLVYADPSELEPFKEKPELSFDDFKSFRLKLNGVEHENYDELIFVDKLEKIITQHPFVDIRTFVMDYLSGLSSYKILKKFQLNSRLENFRIGSKYLGFSGKRVTDQEDNLSQNLKKDVWNAKYFILLKCFSFFKKELDQLTYHNVLRGLTIVCLSENTSNKFNISNIDEIKNFSISHIDKINSFTNLTLKHNFLDFLETKKFKNEIKLILNELKAKKILHSKDDEIFEIQHPFKNIKNSLLDLLTKYEQGITQSNFNYKIISTHPEFRLIPFDLIWNLIMNPLEIDEIIVRKHTQVWLGRPFNDMIFTKQNFESMIKFLRNQLEEFGQFKFFGRHITPDKFIDELIELKKGSYDDSDDQVTRLAGLCLSDSVMTSSTSEKLIDFDFSIDVSDYRFRAEQIESMKKSKFKLFCPILHCKVMVNEVLDTPYLKHLYSIIPEGHQAIIFSFMPQNSSVKLLLKNNSTIQVVDEKGIRFWVEITPNIPSRVGSVAQIQYDPINDYRGKTVRLDSVNYETGMSTVTMLPELKQTNIHIRSLKEIELFDKSNDDFINFSRNYFEFLKKLSMISDLEEFNVGLFNISPDEITEYSNSWTVKFDDITSEIEMNNHVQTKNYRCSCWTFSDNPSKLCRHLVTSLNKIAIDENYLQSIFTEGNFLYDGIMNFIAYLTYNQIESITDFSDYNVAPFFKKFMGNLISEDN